MDQSHFFFASIFFATNLFESIIAFFVLCAILYYVEVDRNDEEGYQRNFTDIFLNCIIIHV